MRGEPAKIRERLEVIKEGKTVDLMDELLTRLGRESFRNLAGKALEISPDEESYFNKKEEDLTRKEKDVFERALDAVNSMPVSMLQSSVERYKEYLTTEISGQQNDGTGKEQITKNQQELVATDRLISLFADRDKASR